MSSTVKPPIQYRNFPPMFSPQRFSPRSSSTLLASTPICKQSQQEKKSHRLSSIIENIHRRQEEHSDDTIRSNFASKSYHNREQKEIFETSKQTESPQSFPNHKISTSSLNDAMPRESFLKYRVKSSPVTSPKAGSPPFDVDQLICEIEERRKRDVEKSILLRKQRVEKFSENLRITAIAKLEEKLNFLRLEEESINNSFKDFDEDSADLRLRLEQERLHKEHLRRESDREARLQAFIQAELAAAAKEKAIQDQYEETLRRQSEVARENKVKHEQKARALSAVKKSFSQFETVVAKTKTALDQSYVQESLSQNGCDLIFIHGILNGEDFEVQEAERLSVELGKVSKNLLTRFEEIEEQRKKEKEEEKNKEEQRLAAEAAARKAAAELPAVSAQPVSADGVSQANLELYQRVANVKHQFENGIKPLLENPEMKTFVFSCKKAVNTPVNSIGRATPGLLMEKIKTLISLLRGEPVEIQETQFVASSHPSGVAYCKNLLAKKLIKQGEDVIRAQPKDAFTVATVLVAVWSEFPDFGELFLGHLFDTCPFLIPCQYAKKDDMSDEDYYKKLGYRFDAQNRIEDQVTFEGRMGGVGRLYAAIFVTTLPKESLRAKKEHPHGIGNAWRWVASVLNLKPVCGVTTTLLVNMLEVCGHELRVRYGNHFLKLVTALSRDFLNHLKPVSLEASVNRLQMVLEKIFSGSLREPEGYIKPGYL